MRKIITIGREFGSGGRELGRRLSEQLQIAYYDREIVTEIAKRTRSSEEYVRQISEKKPVESFPIHVGHTFPFYPMPDPVFQHNMTIFSEQHKLLVELAKKSDCIIIGRCADHILREMKPFRIFVYADEESKLQRCIERKPADELLSDVETRRQMKEVDKERAKYYAYFSGQKWGAKENYDLMINTSGQKIKKIAGALAAYLQDAD